MASESIDDIPANAEKPSVASEPIDDIPANAEKPGVASEPIDDIPLNAEKLGAASEPIDDVPSNAEKPGVASEPIDDIPANAEKPGAASEPIDDIPSNAEKLCAASEPIDGIPANAEKPGPASEPIDDVPANGEKPGPASEPIDDIPANAEKPGPASEPINDIPANAEMPPRVVSGRINRIWTEAEKDGLPSRSIEKIWTDAELKGIDLHFEFDQIKIADYVHKTQTLYVGCTLPWAFIGYPLYSHCARQNGQDFAAAQHVGLTKEGILYCDAKRRTYSRCDAFTKGMHKKFIPFDKIVDLQVLHPAGACCLVVEETCARVSIKIAGNSVPELTLLGLKEPEKFMMHVRKRMHELKYGKKDPRDAVGASINNSPEQMRINDGSAGGGASNNSPDQMKSDGAVTGPLGRILVQQGGRSKGSHFRSAPLQTTRRRGTPSAPPPASVGTILEG